MTILRGDIPADAFTIIPNAWLRDPKISAKAKGLLCYIVSHAAGYQLTIEQMVREMDDSITAIRSGLVELEKAGYLKRERSRGDDGRMGTYEYSIGDVSAGQLQSTKPTVENSTVDHPPVGGVTTKKNSSEKTTSKKTTSSPSVRGTRLPEDFKPTEEMIMWARTGAPGIGWSEHEKFVDYWIAQPGQKGVKTDWPATWRNWMRRASEDRGGQPTSGAPVGAKFKNSAERTAEHTKKVSEIYAMIDVVVAANPGLDLGDPQVMAGLYKAAEAEHDKRVEGCTSGAYTGAMAVDGTVVSALEVTAP